MVSRRKRLELRPRRYSAASCTHNERIDEIDLTQWIEALLSECEVLLVVSIVETAGKYEAIDRFKINRAEDRIRGIIHRELLGCEQWCEEDRFLRQA